MFYHLVQSNYDALQTETFDPPFRHSSKNTIWTWTQIDEQTRHLSSGEWPASRSVVLKIICKNLNVSGKIVISNNEPALTVSYAD